MKTKIKQESAVTRTLPAITDVTRSKIGRKISTQLDLMNDPRFKLDNYQMIEEQDVRSYTVSASNGEMFVSFSIEWKGGTK